jgi:hypothetical protein
MSSGDCALVDVNLMEIHWANLYTAEAYDLMCTPNLTLRSSLLPLQYTTLPGDCALVDVNFMESHWANPELTPVAIRAGQLLAQRLYGGATVTMDYSLVSDRQKKRSCASVQGLQ